MTTVDGAVSTFWRYLKAYPETVMGTGNEAFANKFRESFKSDGFKWKNLGGVFKDSFEATLEHNEKQITKNGGFWKNLKNNFTSLFTDIPKKWKQAGAIADTKKLSGLGKFGLKLKGVGKVLGKRMPLLAAASVILFELPNLFRTTANEGLLAGAGEAGKTAVRLGIVTIGGAIGTALTPFCPFLGGIVGYAIGDMIGRFVVGKSYTEKKEEEKTASNPANANSQFQFDTSMLPNGGKLPTDEELEKMRQAYLQASNPNGSMNFMNQMPQMPQTNFSTLA